MDQKTYAININLKDRAYKAFVGDGNANDLVKHLNALNVNQQIAIISTPPVSSLYLDKILRIFNSDWYVNHYDVPDGEASKSSECVSKIYTWLINQQYERNATIVTLGGGVVGDLAGFVAATYMRGVNLVHVPTSLLAQVDSSIGGKVGINHSLGKNLIGAFYQPRLVVSDISFLQTLPPEEYVCGLGEVIKYGILSQGDLFEKLEEGLQGIWDKDPLLLTDIVQSCVRIKAKIVEKDEMEQGIRAYLNLGHTFAHALETFYRYEGLKHGQAVILGIKCALAVSRSLKLINKEDSSHLERLIDRIPAGIPKSKDLDREQLLSIMKRDKKTRDGNINLVLPQGAGSVILKPVTNEKIILDSFSVLG
jgi:3-dehydroquinate synthase